MNFSYNGHLDFYERVDLVTKEICKEYPLISKRDASIAAAQAIMIDDYVTNDEKFDRYYYIMQTIGRNHEEFFHVFNDAFKIYEQGLNNVLFIDVMPKIFHYANGERDTFPSFNEG